jgi:hypothetical protein
MRSATCARVENEGDDESGRVSRITSHVGEDVPIETQNFGENENEHHADKDPRLAHEGAHTLLQLASLPPSLDRRTYSVSHNSDGVSGSQAGQAN